MHGPAVGDSEGSRETFGGKVGHHLRKGRCDLVPRFQRDAACRHGAERIETEADIDGARRIAARADDVGERKGNILRQRSEIEVDIDAPIEMHLGKRLFEGVNIRGERSAIVAHSAFEDEMQSSRAIVEVFEDLAVGGRGVGKSMRCMTPQGAPGAVPG